MECIINNTGVAKKVSEESEKCFFCNCSDKLKGFKNFFICENCINYANAINEETE